MTETTLPEAGTTPRFAAAAVLGDIPPGWVLRVRIGGRDVALANHAGTIHAFDNSCTHAGGPLGDNRIKDGCLVECPWHNAMFDVRTGEVHSGPARKPQPTYPVKVEGDTVFVAVG
ncbi:MAG: Rieske 2Fe-2S domain-containing protein [Streptosporangiales bacterium]|nr:Rieske 2Fe-2S domain-containing protein [Streptosporangiales bacterium]